MSVMGGFKVLRGGMRSICRALSRMRDHGTLTGAYLEYRGGIGSLGLESSFVGGFSAFDRQNGS